MTFLKKDNLIVLGKFSCYFLTRKLLLSLIERWIAKKSNNTSFIFDREPYFSRGQRNNFHLHD